MPSYRSVALTMLLSLRLLGETITKVWETTRDILDDEGLRANLLAPLEDDTPDVRISLNTAEVPDPITPAVLTVIEKEQGVLSTNRHVGPKRTLICFPTGSTKPISSTRS